MKIMGLFRDKPVAESKPIDKASAIEAEFKRFIEHAERALGDAIMEHDFVKAREFQISIRNYTHAKALVRLHLNKSAKDDN